jgi:hypothetical protein
MFNILKFVILLYIHQASCFVLHHIEHTLLSRVVPVNEEGNVVTLVPEEEQCPVEVGFDICGTDLEPEIPVNQGNPQMHLNFSCIFKSFTSLMLMLCCIR